MSFISSLASASLFGFGPAHISVGKNIYYYEGPTESDTTSTWSDLSKWYKDIGRTLAASSLPDANSHAILLNNTSANIETWTAPEIIELNGKTLTLKAHTKSTGCAAAVSFSVPVIDSSVGSVGLLSASGHISLD